MIHSRPPYNAKHRLQTGSESIVNGVTHIRHDRGVGSFGWTSFVFDMAGFRESGTFLFLLLLGIRAGDNISRLVLRGEKGE